MVKKYYWCIAIIWLVLELGCSASKLNHTTVSYGDEAKWDRYRPVDLAAVMSQHAVLIDVQEDNVLNINAIAHQIPYRIRMNYDGETKNISKKKQELILYWAKSIGADNKFVKLFNSEVAFQHDNKTYWFPIQSQLLPFLYKEVHLGEDIFLYTMLIGTLKENGQVQWVFIVNEFRKGD